MIAAARLGLSVGSIGHLGRDVFGDFLERVLREEQVAKVQTFAPSLVPAGPPMDQTLVCYVLVDPQGRHAFCSRYDFGPWPLLQGVESLPEPILNMLASTRAVFTNGFVFDELPLGIVEQAARVASRAGAAICFDPGPRCFTMRSGSRRRALDTLLDLSDVVLMTMEEAREVTGEDDAEAAARAVLSRRGAATTWCIIKQGGDGALLLSKDSPNSHHARAIRVPVSDTVGCGDSFAAAVVLGYIRSHCIPSTLTLANAVGAATAMRRGAGRNVATAARVAQLLEGAGSSGGHEPRHVEQALSILQMSLDEASSGGAGAWEDGGVPRMHGLTQHALVTPPAPNRHCGTNAARPSPRQSKLVA